mgnify:CR=1 FL=1
MSINHYFKIHSVITLIIMSAILFMVVLLLPSEKKEKKEISQKNYELAQNYDDALKDYKDPAVANKLRNEITEIKSDNVFTSLLKVAAVSFIIGAIIVLLANFLQFAFTKIKFVSTVMVSNEPYRVLSMIFLCSTLIVLVVYISNLLE